MVVQPPARSPEYSKISGIIITVILGVIAVAIFFPIPIFYRIVLVVILLLVLIVDISANLHLLQNYRAKRENARRLTKIRAHQDLINDLFRLNQRLHEVLFENRSNGLCLKTQGEKILNLTAASTTAEFNEKMKILENSYQSTYNRINQERFSKKITWTSDQFGLLVSELDGRLVASENVLIDIYRVPSYARELQSQLEEAKRLWANFREEYNPVIYEWKTFHAKVIQAIGFLGESQAKITKPIS